jgi:hypothetical protein
MIKLTVSFIKQGKVDSRKIIQEETLTQCIKRANEALCFSEYNAILDVRKHKVDVSYFWDVWVS